MGPGPLLCLWWWAFAEVQRVVGGADDDLSVCMVVVGVITFDIDDNDTVIVGS